MPWLSYTLGETSLLLSRVSKFTGPECLFWVLSPVFLYRPREWLPLMLTAKRLMQETFPEC